MSNDKSFNNVPSGPNNKDKFGFETLQLHAGQEQPDPSTGARAVPIYMSTSYVFKDAKQAADRFALKEGGNIYGRLTNDTQLAFEKRIAALEGGSSALAVASGAAALTYTFQALANAGDHIVSSNNIYGGTYNTLANTLSAFGIKTTFVNPDNFDNFENAIKENTRAVLIETFGNPNATLYDIDKLAKIVHKHKIPLIVDNTFATPYLFRPLEHGADICIESATKFIGGHGLALGGVIIESGNFDWKSSGKFPKIVNPDPSYHGLPFYETFGPCAFTTWVRAVLLRDTGACISPVAAFTLLEGLETLSLRVERHVQNSLAVVEYLSKNPKVAKVNHPSLKNHPNHALYERYFPNGAGSIFTFEIKGTREDAQKFCESLQLFSFLANVADMKSLVIHPASTTHSQLSPSDLEAAGIKQTTIRLSIGCESIKDIIADFDQAFAKI